MRILQINAVSTYGSTGRNVAEIEDYLNSRGDVCATAAPIGRVRTNGYKIGTGFDRKVHSLLSRILGTQAYFSRGSTKKLLKYMERYKPDIVHLNNLHGNYINLRMLFEFLIDKDIPTVITLHDCWFYTGKCCHYTVDQCNRWETGCGNCPRLHKDNPSWFFDRTPKMWKDKKRLISSVQRLAVVGVSDWITNEARGSFLASSTRTTRIYNWIDLEIFRPTDSDILREKLGVRGKFIVLGVASGWSNAKGLNMFIELAESIPDNMIIILVGNINSYIPLPSNVIHIEETGSTNELVEYYSLADVLANLSMEETFGKVSAEALACGTPIITYGSTANPELVGDGCGYVIDNNDICNIKKYLFEICENGKHYYSEKCVAFAEANFNKRDRIEDYRMLYNEMIKI